MAPCATCLVRSGVNRTSRTFWELGREERGPAERRPSTNQPSSAALAQRMESKLAFSAKMPCMGCGGGGVPAVASPARRLCLFLIIPGGRV